MLAEDRFSSSAFGLGLLESPNLFFSESQLLCTVFGVDEIVWDAISTSFNAHQWKLPKFPDLQIWMSRQHIDHS